MLPLRILVFYQLLYKNNLNNLILIAKMINFGIILYMIYVKALMFKMY